MTPAEWKRKAVHAGMGLFALALRYLDWKTAALCAGAALAFNVFAMPKIGRAIYRSSVPRRDTGIVAYPAMVLLLILVFGDTDLPLVAAVWAMMAFGDPAAAIAGRTAGGPALPWNRDKTWVGLLANWAVAGATSAPPPAAAESGASPAEGITNPISVRVVPSPMAAMTAQ